MSKARLEIVNWRGHGDDESYVAYDVRTNGITLVEVLQEERQRSNAKDPESFVYNPEYDAEYAEDYDNLVYVNDNFSFANGETIKARDGSLWRISISKVRTGEVTK
jgi:hypothetical protein